MSARLHFLTIDNDIVSHRDQCEKAKMETRAEHGEVRRRVTLAWTVVLSLALAWIGAQPRLADFPARSALASFAAAQAPDQVATLSAAGKMHRSPEFRQGSDPDAAAVASSAFSGINRINSNDPLCEPGAPACREHRTLPEPRAPPVI